MQRLGASYRARTVRWLALIAYLLTQGYSPIGAEDKTNFAGQLLVATDEMRDPRFIETVIYIVKDNSEGTLGLVINRPLARGPVDDLLKGFGAEPTSSQLEVIVHHGGPVSGLQGFVLHSDDLLLESSVRVKDGLAMTSDIKMIEAIASDKGPGQFLIMLGYAGWAPEQLEAEIKSNAWFVLPADKTLIFGKDADKKWRRAMDRRQTPL
jgi:putative transcriptional regulator